MTEKKLPLSNEQPDAPHTETRVTFLRLRKKRQRLVGACIEGSNHRRLRCRKGCEHLAKGSFLFSLRGRLGFREEKKLASEHPDALGAISHRQRAVSSATDVGKHLQTLSVLTHAPPPTPRPPPPP